MFSIWKRLELCHLIKNSFHILTLSETTNFGLQNERVCRQRSLFSCKWQKVLQGVQNTLGKQEVACHQQFLLSLQCFQKNCSVRQEKQGLVWERVNPFPNDTF